MTLSNKIAFIALPLALAGWSLAQAQDFKMYPGAKADEVASRAASAAAPGKESLVFTTKDSIEEVSAFYKGLYKEIKMHSVPPKLATGEQIQWAFFAIDGGATLAQSKYWMKVQRPYIGGADGKDVRNVTVIQTVRTK